MKKYGIIALVFFLTSCLKEDPLKKDYTGYSPLDIGDGWIIGSAKQNNVDSNALSAVYRSVYADDGTWPMKSLLVFRNGELIAESYLKDEIDRTKPQAIWSCTKQIMALLAGTLVDKGELFLTDRLQQFLESYTNKNRDKENITIGNLLSMRSGIGFNNDEHSDVFRKRETNSSIDFVLGLPLNYVPGTYFNYNDGDPQLLSAIISNLSFKSTDVYADDVLFSTIGLTNYKWERYPPDGVTMGGFGILTTPRELAKVGQLVLNKGWWDSTEVISESWIDSLFISNGPVSGISNVEFGKYWWLNPSKNYQFMWGHGGQYVFLIPDKNAMVVITSIEQLATEFTVYVDEATAIVDRIAATLK